MGEAAEEEAVRCAVEAGEEAGPGGSAVDDDAPGAARVGVDRAAQGARELMLSQTKRDEIEQLINNIEHVELETMEDFFDVFVEGCQFKPMMFH